jgi:hypothetical protein
MFALGCRGQLDLRCLTLMKTKMLRASCIARGLPKKGGKRTLVQRLTASLTEQRSAGRTLLPAHTTS